MRCGSRVSQFGAKSPRSHEMLDGDPGARVELARRAACAGHGRVRASTVADGMAFAHLKNYWHGQPARLRRRWRRIHGAR